MNFGSQVHARTIPWSELNWRVDQASLTMVYTLQAMLQSYSTGTRKVCKRMAFWAACRGLGLFASRTFGGPGSPCHLGDSSYGDSNFQCIRAPTTEQPCS